MIERRQRIVIVAVLAAVAGLYVVALGLGLGAGRGGSVSVATIERGIGGRLDDLLGRFAPRAQVERLYCRRQRLSDGVRLTAADPQCRFVIPASEQRYRRLELEVQPPRSTPVWLKSARQRDGDYTLNVACVPYGDVAGAPRLEVDYQPAGGAAAADPCWVRQARDEPVSLVVMAAGAALTIECRGCSQSPRRELTVSAR